MFAKDIFEKEFTSQLRGIIVNVKIIKMLIIKCKWLVI